MTDDGDIVDPEGDGPDPVGAGDDALEAVTLDPADADPTPGPSTRRNVAVGAAVVGALVIAAVVAVLFWPSEASGYDADVESNFMAACTADGGDDVEPVCACLYDEIVQTIPYDRFEEVNDALETEQAADGDGDGPVRLPADFDEIRQTCVDRHGAPPPTTTSTAAPEAEADPTTTAPPETATTSPAPDSPVVTGDAPNAAVPGGVRPTPPPRPPPPPPSPPSPPAPPGSSNDGGVPS